MSSSPEQIQAFEKQISNSLEHQMNQLIQMDSEKSETLRILKGVILASIGKENSKYTTDLQITNGELEEIFSDIQKSQPSLLKENSIQSFNEFQEFIGITNTNNDPKNLAISFAHTLEKISLFGKTVELILPIGTNEQVIQNYQQAIGKIEGRVDLKNYINSGTRLTPLGGVRLEFNIQKDAKDIKYSAMPDGVFRVDSEPTLEQRKEWKEVIQKKKNLEEIFRSTIKNDPNRSEKLEDALMWIIYGRGEMVKKLDVQIPEQYQIMLNQIKKYNQDQAQLYELCSTRKLIDDTTGKMVDEIGDPKHVNNVEIVDGDLKYVNNVEYRFQNQEGKLDFSVSFLGNKKKIHTQYLESGKELKKTFFHDNGRVQRIDESSENGAYESKRYRIDGTLEELEHKKAGENYQTDIYDTSGKNIIYQRTRSQDGKYSTKMIGEDGSIFGTLVYNSGEKASITNNQYLDQLAKNLDTPQKLYLFFELFMRYVHDDPAKAGIDHRTANIGGNNDYWQTAEETIHRVKEGKMLGDCDDYAFLAQSILRRQGKAAFVQGIPAHAICTWTEKRSDGKYDAYSLCTFGLDKNGNRYGMKQDPEKEKGYNTIEEAVNSLMPKYDNSGIGLVTGAGGYRISNGKIDILNIPVVGKNEKIINVPVDLLGKPDILDALIDANKLDHYFKKGPIIKRYEELVSQYPNEPFLRVKLANLYSKESPDKSEILLKQLIQENPKDPDLFISLGDIFEYQNHEKAQEYYQQAINLGSKNEKPYMYVSNILQRNSRYSNQIQVIELAIQNIGGASLNTVNYLNLADAYIHIGNPKKAIDIYEGILSKDFRAIAPLALLYYSHEGDYKKARTMYLGVRKYDEGSIEQYKESANFHNLLRKESMKNGINGVDKKFLDTQGNILISPEYLKKNPSIADLHKMEIADLEKICEIPTEQNQYQCEDLIKRYVESGNITKAIEFGQRAIREIDGANNDNDISTLLIGIYLDTGNMNEALKLYYKNPRTLDFNYFMRSGLGVNKLVKFYENIVSISPSITLYRKYITYLIDTKQMKKLQEVIGQAKQKFPEQKEIFEEYIK